MRFATALLTVTLLASSARAMPLSPESIAHLRASGRLAEVGARERAADDMGVEHPNANILPGLRASRRDDANQTTVHMPVILVDFADDAANRDAYPADHYTSLIFSENEYQTGSVHDWYLETSYGEILVVGTVVSWVRAPQTYAYYVDGNNGYNNWPHNVQKLVVDAVSTANDQINYSTFDNNGDGTVEGVLIIHAGSGAEANNGDVNMIWSHSWDLGNHAVRLDGVTISNYCIVPEDCRIGVVGHEMGHLYFGLPDLYDTDYSSEGLGMWTMMAAGSWGGNGLRPVQWDAWCKIQVGVIQPTRPAHNLNQVVISPVESGATAYELWTSGAIGAQHFLVENRQQIGFDGAIPGPGLLIYHVDQNVRTGNTHEWYPGHQANGHYLVALEQADGAWDLEHARNSGDASDPYPGDSLVQQFNSNTSPNSHSYAGAATRVALNNIQSHGQDVSADILVGVAAGNVPSISVDQGALEYGVVGVNMTEDIVLTVSNVGTVRLEVQSTTIIGADQNEFAVTNGGGAFGLDPQQSQGVTVRFEPATAGEKNATLRIASNDQDQNPRDIPLHGFGSGVPQIIQPSDSANLAINIHAGDTLAVHFRAIDPDRGQLTWVITNRGRLPQQAEFVDHGDGTADLNWLTPRVAARYAPIFQVTDPDSQTVQIRLFITLAAPGSPPVWRAPNPNPSVLEDCQRTAILDLDTLFSDADGDSLTFVLSAAPIELGALLDNNRVISVQPAHDFNSPNGAEVRVTATDPTGLNAEGVFRVIVVPVNDPPAAFDLVSPSQGDRIAAHDVPFIWRTSHDVDGDVVHYTLHLEITDPTTADLSEPNLSDTTGRFRGLTDEFLTSIGAQAGASGTWWVEASDSQATTVSNSRWTLHIPPLAVANNKGNLPQQFAVSEGFPNPFNSTIRISYSLPQSAHVRIVVYSLSGSLASSLTDGVMPAGRWATEWNGRDIDGHELPAGVYLIRVEAGPMVKIIKAALVR